MEFEEAETNSEADVVINMSNMSSSGQLPRDWVNWIFVSNTIELELTEVGDWFVMGCDWSDVLRENAISESRENACDLQRCWTGEEGIAHLWHPSWHLGNHPGGGILCPYTSHRWELLCFHKMSSALGMANFVSCQAEFKKPAEPALLLGQPEPCMYIPFSQLLYFFSNISN